MAPPTDDFDTIARWKLKRSALSPGFHPESELSTDPAIPLTFCRFPRPLRHGTVPGHGSAARRCGRMNRPPDEPRCRWPRVPLPLCARALGVRCGELRLQCGDVLVHPHFRYLVVRD